MLSAVRFDNQSMLVAVEICGVRSNGMLTTELCARQSTIPKQTPKLGFHIGHIPTQRTCRRLPEIIRHG
jgi:hypothetical protein